MKLYDENKYEEEYVAGDNWQTSFQVTTPQTKIRYRDTILICEVYEEPNGVMVNLLCPKCKHSLRIQSKNKAIEWDPKTKRISVEASGCSWEIDPDLAVGVLTHTNLCNFRFVVDNNLMRDA